MYQQNSEKHVNNNLNKYSMLFYTVIFPMINRILFLEDIPVNKTFDFTEKWFWIYQCQYMIRSW